MIEGNYILESLKKANESHKKIYIYGCSLMGKIVSKRLDYEGIEYEAFVVDAEYATSRTNIQGHPVLNIEDVIEKSVIGQDKPVVVVAFRYSNEEQVSKYKDVAEIIDEDVLSLWCLDENENEWTKSYLENNRKLLLETYEMLADEKSREHMNAFLRQKLSGRLSYLRDVWESNQYYDNDIIDFSRVNTFVDCGAYDGDSFLSFAENYAKNTEEKYAGAAYLLEPNGSNYERMMRNCSSYRGVTCCQVGASNKKDVLEFSSEDSLSGFSGEGNIMVEVDTIDHITGENADFIKMDIEDAELEALQGAANTIKKCHPILTICVYHKSSDLWTIPQYIKSIDSTYKFYIRAHSRYSMELVLYAI